LGALEANFPVSSSLRQAEFYFLLLLRWQTGRFIKEAGELMRTPHI
jgi:hypothetical protein